MAKLKLKLNHYHLQLMDPSGYILLETDIMYNDQQNIQRTMKYWASIKNAHELIIFRGVYYQHYFKKVIGNNHEFTWERRGPVLQSGYHLKY